MPLDSVISIGIDGRLEREILAIYSKIERRGLNINTSKSRSSLGSLTGDVDTFNESLSAANARVLAFGASAGVIAGVSVAFREFIKNSIQVEKSIQDIQVVLNASSKDLAKFSDGLFDIAKNTAQSFDVVAKAATELSRQGLSAQETLKRTSDALILTRLSGLDAAKSVESLTASVNGFRSELLDTTQVVNRLANVDAAFAVSSEDLAEALERVGATAQDAKVDFNQLIATVASLQQTTSRGGSVIGGSLKTIFTRLQRTDTLNQLEALGVSVKDLEGNTRPAIAVLQDLAKVYKTLGDSQKASVSETVAGVYQINQFKALISDLGSEYSIYNRALETANSTTDEAIRRNELLNKTLSALSSQALSNFVKISASIGELTLGPAIERLLVSFNDIADLGSNLDAEGSGKKIGEGFLRGIGNAIAGPGLLVAGVLAFKFFSKFSKFALQAGQDLLNSTKVSEKTLLTQNLINDLLAQNVQLHKSLLNPLASVEAKNRIILNILRQQVSVQRDLNVVATSATSYIAPRITTNKTRVVSIGARSGGYAPNMRDAQYAENVGARSAGYSAGKATSVMLKKSPFGGRSIHSGGYEPAIINDREEVLDHPKYGSAVITPTSKGRKVKEKLLNAGFTPRGGSYAPNFGFGEFFEEQKLRSSQSYLKFLKKASVDIEVYNERIAEFEKIINKGQSSRIISGSGVLSENSGNGPAATLQDTLALRTVLPLVNERGKLVERVNERIESRKNRSEVIKSLANFGKGAIRKADDFFGGSKGKKNPYGLFTDLKVSNSALFSPKSKVNLDAIIRKISGGSMTPSATGNSLFSRNTQTQAPTKKQYSSLNVANDLISEARYISNLQDPKDQKRRLKNLNSRFKTLQSKDYETSLIVSRSLSSRGFGVSNYAKGMAGGFAPNFAKFGDFDVNKVGGSIRIEHASGGNPAFFDNYSMADFKKNPELASKLYDNFLFGKAPFVDAETQLRKKASKSRTFGASSFNTTSINVNDGSVLKSALQNTIGRKLRKTLRKNNSYTLGGQDTPNFAPIDISRGLSKPSSGIPIRELLGTKGGMIPYDTYEDLLRDLFSNRVSAPNGRFNSFSTDSGIAKLFSEVRPLAKFRTVGNLDELTDSAKSYIINGKIDSGNIIKSDEDLKKIFSQLGGYGLANNFGFDLNSLASNSKVGKQFSSSKMMDIYKKEKEIAVLGGSPFASSISEYSPKIFTPNFSVSDAVKAEKSQVSDILGIPKNNVKTKVVRDSSFASGLNPQGYGVISPSLGQHSAADAKRDHKGENLAFANLDKRTPNFAPSSISNKRLADLGNTGTNTKSLSEYIQRVLDSSVQRGGRVTKGKNFLSQGVDSEGSINILSKGIDTTEKQMKHFSTTLDSVSFDKLTKELENLKVEKSKVESNLINANIPPIAQNESARSVRDSARSSINNLKQQLNDPNIGFENAKNLKKQLVIQETRLSESNAALSESTKSITNSRKLKQKGRETARNSAQNSARKTVEDSINKQNEFLDTQGSGIFASVFGGNAEKKLKAKFGKATSEGATERARQINQERVGGRQNALFGASFALPLLGGVAGTFAKTTGQRDTIEGLSNAASSAASLAAFGGPAAIAAGIGIGGFQALSTIMKNLNNDAQELSDGLAEVVANNQSLSNSYSALGQSQASFSDIIGNRNSSDTVKRRAVEQLKEQLSEVFSKDPNLARDFTNASTSEKKFDVLGQAQSKLSRKVRLQDNVGLFAGKVNDAEETFGGIGKLKDKDVNSFAEAFSSALSSPDNIKNIENNISRISAIGGGLSKVKNIGDSKGSGFANNASLFFNTIKDVVTLKDTRENGFEGFKRDISILSGNYGSGTVGAGLGVVGAGITKVYKNITSGGNEEIQKGIGEFGKILTENNINLKDLGVNINGRVIDSLDVLKSLNGEDIQSFFNKLKKSLEYKSLIEKTSTKYAREESDKRQTLNKTLDDIIKASGQQEAEINIANAKFTSGLNRSSFQIGANRKFQNALGRETTPNQDFSDFKAQSQLELQAFASDQSKILTDKSLDIDKLKQQLPFAEGEEDSALSRKISEAESAYESLVKVVENNINLKREEIEDQIKVNKAISDLTNGYAVAKQSLEKSNQTIQGRVSLIQADQEIKNKKDTIAGLNYTASSGKGLNQFQQDFVKYGKPLSDGERNKAEANEQLKTSSDELLLLENKKLSLLNEKEFLAKQESLFSQEITLFDKKTSNEKRYSYYLDLLFENIAKTQVHSNEVITSALTKKKDKSSKNITGLNSQIADLETKVPSKSFIGPLSEQVQKDSLVLTELKQDRTRNIEDYERSTVDLIKNSNDLATSLKRVDDVRNIQSAITPNNSDILSNNSSGSLIGLDGSIKSSSNSAEISEVQERISAIQNRGNLGNNGNTKASNKNIEELGKYNGDFSSPLSSGINQKTVDFQRRNLESENKRLEALKSEDEALNSLIKTQTDRNKSELDYLSVLEKIKSSQDQVQKSKIDNAIASGASTEEVRSLVAQRGQQRGVDGQIGGISDALNSELYVNQSDLTDVFEIASSGIRDLKSELSTALTDIIYNAKDAKTALKAAGIALLQSIQKKAQDALTDRAIGAGTQLLMSALSSVGGSGAGGGGQGYAEGGKVYGGSGTKDDVPAMLNAGEFVIKKSATGRYGDSFLSSLNSGRVKFANGGSTKEEYGSLDTGKATSSGFTGSTSVGNLFGEAYKSGKVSDLKGKGLSEYAITESIRGRAVIQEADRIAESRAEFERELAAFNKKYSNKNAYISVGLAYAQGAISVAGRTAAGGYTSSAGAFKAAPYATSVFRGSSGYIPNAVRFAEGGMTPIGTDRIPAMLTAGEFVLNKGAVDKYGTDFAHSVNEGKFDPRRASYLAEGGLVGKEIGSSGINAQGQSKVPNDVDSGSTNNITITVNITKDGSVSVSNSGLVGDKDKGDSEGGENKNQGDQEEYTQTKQFAKQLEAAVLTVMEKYSRSGGYYDSSRRK